MRKKRQKNRCTKVRLGIHICLGITEIRYIGHLNGYNIDSAGTLKRGVEYVICGYRFYMIHKKITLPAQVNDNIYCILCYNRFREEISVAQIVDFSNICVDSYLYRLLNPNILVLLDCLMV